MALALANIDFIADETEGWASTNYSSFVSDPDYNSDNFKQDIMDEMNSCSNYIFKNANIKYIYKDPFQNWTY